MCLVLAHPCEFSTHHVIICHVMYLAMDRHQRHIGEFVVLSGKKKSFNTVARPKITSEVILIDCRDYSETDEAMDEAWDEATMCTCPPISAVVLVRRLDDIEEEIQLVSQVSAVTQHQSAKKSSEEMVSGVDFQFSHSCSNLVDYGRPDGSISLSTALLTVHMVGAHHKTVIVLALVA